jgi:copper chaperone CopZ
MTTTTLKIDGMTCGHCAGRVRQALQSVESVTVKQVTAGGATVEYDEAIVSPTRIAEAVTQAGYTASAAE